MVSDLLSPEPLRLAERRRRVRERMVAESVAAIVLSAGADLFFLTGYDAMPLERQTLLVLPADESVGILLLVPELELARVPGVTSESGVEVVGWNETEDPLAIAVRHVSPELDHGDRVGVSDRMWAAAVLGLEKHLRADVELVLAGKVISPVRAVKDAWEVGQLSEAAAAVDDVAERLTEFVRIGATETEVSAQIGAALIENGLDRVGFVIVASGPNASSPHHTPGPREIEKGDWVVCDFGGPMSGYWADITRTVRVGNVSEPDADLYSVLEAAEAAAFEAVAPGVTAADVDAAARAVITDAGYGDYFIHRTGHGIGLDEHEEPYIVDGNMTALAAGMTFSVEPGIYIPGRCGARLENIVTCTDHGARRLNQASRALQVVP